jgi:hypothetical protein
VGLLKAVRCSGGSVVVCSGAQCSDYVGIGSFMAEVGDRGNKENMWATSAGKPSNCR